MALTLADITRVYNDEAAAYLLLESIRWPDGPICPHCGTVDDAHYMEPRGEGRKDRHGKISQRRLWRCHGCRKQFSVLVNTIFGDSHIPLGKWLMGFHLICSAKNGISAHELGRQLEITVKSAWFMAHRIRYAMARQPLAGLLDGTVEVDETYMGGKPRKHLSRSEAAKRRHATKTPVVTLVQRDGEVRSQVMKTVTGKNIREVLVENVSPDATIMTDESNIMSTDKRFQILDSFHDDEYRDAFIEESIRSGLAYQIRATRESRGWSQGELGERAGMAQERVSVLENPDYGKYTIKTLLRLASAFKVGLLVRFVSLDKYADWYGDLSSDDFAVPSYRVKQEPIEELPGQDPLVLYANSVTFRMSVFDLVLNFGQVEDALEEKVLVKPLARVTMSPQHAKVFAGYLTQHIQEYEKQFGPLPQSPQSGDD